MKKSLFLISLLILIFSCSNSKKELNGTYVSDVFLQSDFSESPESNEPVFKIKIKQKTTYNFTNIEFSKTISQNVISIEKINQNFNFNREDFESKLNTKTTIQGEYSIYGNEIFFNCLKITDSNGVSKDYEEFLIDNPTFSDSEYSEEIKIEQDKIIISKEEFNKI